MGLTPFHFAVRVTWPWRGLSSLLVQTSTFVAASLDRAIGYGGEGTAKRITNHRADVNPADANGLIALHHGCTFGKAELVPLLVAKGAAIDALDGLGMTPLQKAVKIGGDSPTQQGLVAAGAELTVRHMGLVCLCCTWRRKDIIVLRVVIDHAMITQWT